MSGNLNDNMGATFANGYGRVRDSAGDIVPSNYSAPLTAAAASSTETIDASVKRVYIRSTHATVTNYFLIAFGDSVANAKAIVDAGEGIPVYGLEKISLGVPTSLQGSTSYLAYIRVSASDQTFHVTQGV